MLYLDSFAVPRHCWCLKLALIRHFLWAFWRSHWECLLHYPWNTQMHFLSLPFLTSSCFLLVHSFLYRPLQIKMLPGQPSPPCSPPLILVLIYLLFQWTLEVHTPFVQLIYQPLPKSCIILLLFRRKPDRYPLFNTVDYIIKLSQ